MLQDGQVWENDKYIIKIEKLGRSWRAVMFLKAEEGLRFVEVILKEEKWILDFFNKQDLRMTGIRKLILKERP